MYIKKIIILAAVMLTVFLFSGCGYVSGGGVLIEEKNLPAFSSISINTSSPKIELIESNRYGIEIFVPERFDTTWDVSDGKLTILVKQKGLGFSLHTRLSSYYVKVYYPAGTVFDDIALKSSSGSIRLPQAEVTYLDIASSSGSIDASAQNWARAFLETSSGSVAFSGSGGKASIVTASGSVQSDIGDCDAIQITTRSGSIVLNSNSNSPVVPAIDTQSGSIRINGVVWQDVTIGSKSGATKINGKLLGNTSAESSSGSVSISVNGDPSQYGYSLTPSSGTIHLDGERIGKPVVSSGSFENNINVSTSSGSIRVDFKGN